MFTTQGGGLPSGFDDGDFDTVRQARNQQHANELGTMEGVARNFGGAKLDAVATLGCRFAAVEDEQELVVFVHGWRPAGY